jgi:hypothetical protein
VGSPEHLGEPSPVQEVEKVDDDRRPRWDTPSVPKKEWKSTISTMKRASSTLTEPAESADTVPFRSSLFPGCLLHAEAELKPKKAFKDAVLKTDAAGACSLAHVRCGELAHAALGKDSPLIQRMKDECAGDLPQTADALLGVMNDSLEELKAIKKEFFKVTNVGSKIAAGIFNQGIEVQRVLVCDSTSAKSIRSTLELCKPSLTHLFGGDESTRRWKRPSIGLIRPPHTAPRLLRISAPPIPRRGGIARRRLTPRSHPTNRPSRKANGPASKKGEGQKKK